MTNDEGINIISRLLDLTVQRHGVIANNLANANTPGYIRRSLQFPEQFAEMIASGRVDELANVRPELAEDLHDPPRLDGNNITLGREMNEMMQNGLSYQLLTRALMTKVRILRTAMS